MNLILHRILFFRHHIRHTPIMYISRTRSTRSFPVPLIAHPTLLLTTTTTILTPSTARTTTQINKLLITMYFLNNLLLVQHILIFQIRYPLFLPHFPRIQTRRIRWIITLVTLKRVQKIPTRGSRRRWRRWSLRIRTRTRPLGLYHL
ncbi:hypothetical protein HanRHA438_Chr12g0559761 [Helianthus annuus]|nr:hypothetical protein HanRHA438_Chr12g0559761 [Helianthus annuus]